MLATHGYPTFLPQVHFQIFAFTLKLRNHTLVFHRFPIFTQIPGRSSWYAQPLVCTHQDPHLDQILGSTAAEGFGDGCRSWSVAIGEDLWMEAQKLLVGWRTS